MFTKPFQSLAIDALCDVVRDMGFDGLDLTVRKGGHVDTQRGNLAAELRNAVNRITAAGLSLPMITSAVLTADDPHAAPIFEAAGALGVPFIKIGYHDYHGFGSLNTSLDTAKKQLDGIEKLAIRTGVCAVIHNHFGGEKRLGASPFLVARLLEGRDPRALAAYVDAGHIVVEGAMGSWMSGLESLSGRVRVLGAKTYGLFPDQPAEAAVTQWQIRPLPFDQGLVPWDRLLTCLRQSGFDGPVTFHSEYRLESPALIEQTRRDLAFFRSAAKAAGY